MIAEKLRQRMWWRASISVLLATGAVWTQPCPAHALDQEAVTQIRANAVEAPSALTGELLKEEKTFHADEARDQVSDAQSEASSTGKAPEESPLAVTYHIELDASEDVEDFLKQYLDLYRMQKRKDLSADDFSLLVERAPQNVQTLLKTQGYFTARATARVANEGGQTTVVLKVEPGAQVIVKHVDIKVTGEITHDAAMLERFQNARQRRLWRLPEGAPFSQEAWAESKRRVLDYMVGTTYAAATITHSEAKIDPKSHEATLTLEIASGPAYTFGEVTIVGLENYPEQVIRDRVRIKSGDRYRRRDLQNLQNDLQSLPYFGGVVVEAPPSEEAPYVAPVVVTVQEVPHNKLDMSVGYSTNYGPRVQTRYTYNNVLNRGWVFDGRLDFSQKEKEGELGLGFPKKQDGYEHRMYAAYSDNDVQNIQSNTGKLGVGRMKSEGNIERAMNLEFLREERHDDYGREDDLKALVFNYRWVRRDVRTQRNPRRGNIVQLEAGGALEGVLSDTSFVRLYGRGAQYWPVGDNDVALLRVGVGQTFTSHPEKVPSDYLFRAGGSNSVRGYDYQSLGIVEQSAVWPGRVLATSSLEYQHMVYKDWRAAVFVDYGDAADRWSDWRGKTGVGVGARWVSPVGMFGADLAYGIDDQAWRFYFSLGLSF